mmetsp:Transcript_11049/g.32222  ORF Transcript_11049/g.32222 Transcript_11049/m.32222 type:complete len:241 (+) Transcript_11049:1881-2603(+)
MAASEKHEPLLNCTANGRLIAAAQLGECLLDQRNPKHRGCRTTCEARYAISAAREPIIDQHNAPIVVRIGIVDEEADHVEPHGRVRGIHKASCSNLLIPSDDVACCQQPLVGKRAWDDPFDLPVIFEEQAWARATCHLFWTAPAGYRIAQAEALAWCLTVKPKRSCSRRERRVLILAATSTIGSGSCDERCRLPLLLCRHAAAFHLHLHCAIQRRMPGGATVAVTGVGCHCCRRCECIRQ